MPGFNCLLVLVAIFQVITSQEQGPPQGPPPGWDKCRGPPPGVKHPQKCCEVTPIFTEEEMNSCGFEKKEGETRRGPPKPPDCSKQECLLKLKKLMKDDNSVDKIAVADFLDEWADEKWKGVVSRAINICLAEEGIPGPPEVCEANRLMFCVGGIVFTECPTWKDSDDCKILKAHIEECKAQNPPF